MTKQSGFTIRSTAMALPKLSNYSKGHIPFKFAVDVVDKRAEATRNLRAMLWTGNTDSHVRELSYEYFSRRSHMSAKLLNNLGVQFSDKMIIMIARVPAW